MKLMQLFRLSRGSRTGFRSLWTAIPFLFLCACGDGDTSIASAPSAPLSPAAPAITANAVFVASPENGELLAHVGQASGIVLQFRASQGSATDLTLSLPSVPGWRAADSPLRCASVDTAGACRLQATYTPTAPAASASLRFSFAYTDNTGASREGVYTLAYRVLPANTVVTSQQPEGAQRGIVGRSTAAAISFDTSDGEPATSLEVSASLAALPAGWTSDSAAFACTSVGGGQPCRLSLSYSPLTPVGASTLELAYRYVDSSGAPRTGAARLDYSAIAAGSVDAAPDPVGLVLVKPGDRKEITVRFAATGGVQASALRLSIDPAATPGWSVKPGWQGCATVDASERCSLTLMFAPAAAFAPRTLSLPYTYVDNTGEARSASVDIDYSSRVYEAYIADYSEDSAGGVRLCTIAADGGLADCAAAAVDLPARGRGISHVLASGRQAYVSSLAAGDRSSVFLCAIAGDGALKDCKETGAIRTGVRRVLLHGASAYILTAAGKILRQDVDVASGEISPCPASRGICEIISLSATITALGFDGTDAYLTFQLGEAAYMSGSQCVVMPNGDFDCSKPPFLTPYYFSAGALAIRKDGNVSRIYIVGEPYYALLDGTHDVIRCNGAIGGCETSAVATFPKSIAFRDITFDGNHAYIVHEENVYRCGVDAGDGKLPDCTALGGTGAARHFALSINHIH